MENQINDLQRIKKHIDDAKAEKSRLEGQLQQLLEQRAEGFGVDSDTAAETYIKELNDQAILLQKEITDGLIIIKEELGWTT